MRRFVVTGVLYVLFTNFTWAMSYEHARVVYKRVLYANGFNPNTELQVDDDESLNAQAYWGRVHVNKGMLRRLKNDDELAMVLGHELSHIKLWHKGGNPNEELEADYLGADYAKYSGYNKCKGAKLLKRLNSRDTRTHPSGYSRYYKLCR